MNDLINAIIGWIGSSADKPGAAVRGLLAGQPEQLMNLIPFSDTMGITDPGQRVSGRDLLGMEDNTLGNIAGFGAEMATDPINWLLGMGLLKNLKAHSRAGQVLEDFHKPTVLDKAKAPMLPMGNASNYPGTKLDFLAAQGEPPLVKHLLAPTHNNFAGVPPGAFAPTVDPEAFALLGFGQNLFSRFGSELERRRLQGGGA